MTKVGSFVFYVKIAIMLDSSSENSWGAPRVPQSESFDASPSVPPPPPEVKVRTMKSDLESMARSGGAAPQFQSVKAPVIPVAEARIVASEEKVKPVWMVVMIVLAVSLLAAIAYFAYQVFSVAKPGSPTIVANPIPVPLAPSPQSASPPPSASGSFIHRSFFRSSADAFLTLTIHTTAQSAADLETFNQRLKDLVSTEGAKGSFFEIGVKDSDGNDLAAADIMKAEDNVVIDPGFFSAHFVSDATLFVYKDKNGLWPGYVLGLQAKDNWLFVKNDAMKLETSPKLVNFFLADPGTPAPEGFKDTIESGQPARILRFTSPAASSSFVYGFFHNRLILSTSEDGLTQAIGRL